MMPMKSSAIAAVLLLLGSLCQAQTTPPQQPPAPPASTDTPGDDGVVGTIKKRVDQVNVVFTVTDKHGRFVKELTQQQFTILDNNKPPAKIENFEAQTNLPLQVGLLIDASNSIRDRFLFEQQAAVEFLQQIVRPQSDRAFVLAFDELPTITQDFTNDIDKLTRGVRVIRPGGGTAMFDAIFYACRDKLLKEKNSGPVRRAIILVSDGDDNQSRVLHQEAIEMAQRAEVIIYAISTNLSNIKDKGDKDLQILADATGGRAFFPFKLHDLSDAFKEIQGELRSQYSVSYKPEALLANGQFRSISIAADNKKLKVRARKGYFAPKE
ncbi:MAG TPA: VWA domain-containing protein [Candidatus Saccharimonadales bacterium]|jgi:Ca-activated chloride channel family protein|nr:VWA domain-containing protein [Candidatus Saccharimonadales bacterium]